MDWSSRGRQRRSPDCLYDPDAFERDTLKGLGMPDEIAGGAIFLASKAGAYVNGQSIVIDGGGTIS